MSNRLSYASTNSTSSQRWSRGFFKKRPAVKDEIEASDKLSEVGPPLPSVFYPGSPDLVVSLRRQDRELAIVSS
jgi:hypothetical protein